MKTLLVCLALICIGVYGAAPEQEDGVYVLTTANFDEFVNDQDFTVVEFYAPWCGHCKKLTPEYAEAAQQLAKNDPPVKIAKVDATIESELGTRFGVSGYPTLKIFRKGTASEYKGPRDATGIVSYISKQSSPAISIFKAKDELEKFLSRGAAVVFYGAKGSALYKAFEAVSGKLRENFRFAQAEGFGDHKDKVVLLQSRQYTQSPLETKEYVFDKSSESDLSDFIHHNFLPLVGEYHEDVDALYRKKNLPLVKLYTDVDWDKNSKGINYVANRVRKIASEFKDKFTFALAHKSKHQKEIEDSGLKGESPFAIHDLGKGHKFPSLASFTPDALKSFLNEYLEGKMEPYVKSEAVPTQVAGEPTVVVGKNFDSIVNDPTKDVLLEAYAPWCGHCKSLDPKYKTLASKLAKYSDTLTIAKVDATANDLPANFAVSGFPTIFFVPANKKSSPMKYEGAREVKDFVSYIKKNAHNKPWEKDGSKDEL